MKSKSVAIFLIILAFANPTLGQDYDVYRYYVRWHVGYDSSNDQHTIKQQGFNSLNQAGIKFYSVANRYAKKLITPIKVESHNDAWAKWIPGGALQKDYVVEWHTGIEDDVDTIQITYHDDESSAQDSFDDDIPDWSSGKFIKPYETLYKLYKKWAARCP